MTLEGAQIAGSDWNAMTTVILAGSFNGLNISAGKIYADTANSKVGVNTLYPSTQLHLAGTTYTFVSQGLSFGDGDTGLYESADDTLRIPTEALIDSILIVTVFTLPMLPESEYLLVLHLLLSQQLYLFRVMQILV